LTSKIVDNFPPTKKYLREKLPEKRHKGKKKISSQKNQSGGELLQGEKGIAGRYVTFLNG